MTKNGSLEREREREVKGEIPRLEEWDTEKELLYSATEIAKIVNF